VSTHESLPDDIDPRLWIMWGEPPIRLYLFGNCHTSVGRMAAFDPSTGQDLCVSKFEITEASDLAQAWIEGYLRGAEPRPPDDQDQEAFSRWQRAMVEFHRQGDLPR